METEILLKNTNGETSMKRFLESVKYFGLRKLYYLIKSTISSLSELLTEEGMYKKERQQSLLKRKISKTLITLYNGDEGHNINTNQYFLGFGLIHYTLVRNLKPKHILCIGSRKGYIPAILALACKDSGDGHVDFVDAGYDQDEHQKHWSGIGFWKKINPRNHFAKIGVENFISTHIMTTKKYAHMYPNKRYQYVYVDGDHSYEGVKLDYQLFWPKLDKGSFMAFHDVVARGYLDKGLFGIWKFWREIEHKHTIVFPFPKDSGLGIIQKL